MGSALAFGLILLLTGCSSSKDAQNDDALRSASEGQDAATADSQRTEAEPPPVPRAEAVPEESPEPGEPAEPDAAEPDEAANPDPYDASTWDQDADAGLIRQHFAAVRNAFHESSHAGYAALAASTWPEHTAQSFADCDYSGQFPGFDVADDEQVFIEHRWSNFIAVPGWEIPTGWGSPADDGFRVYLGDLAFTYSWVFQGERHRDESTGAGHVAINDAGHAVFFPVCDEYLP